MSLIFWSAFSLVAQINRFNSVIQNQDQTGLWASQMLDHYPYGYYILGTTYRSGTEVSMISKLDTLGSVIWSRTYKSESPFLELNLRQMFPGTDSSILVLGEDKQAQKERQLIFLEISDSGKVLGSRALGIDNFNIGLSWGFSSSGKELVLTGYTSPMIPQQYKDFSWTMILDSSGNLIRAFSDTVDGIKESRFASIAEGPDGSYSTLGYAVDTAGLISVLVVRRKGIDSVVWAVKIPVSKKEYMVPNDLKIDKNGDHWILLRRENGFRCTQLDSSGVFKHSSIIAGSMVNSSNVNYSLTFDPDNRPVVFGGGCGGWALRLDSVLAPDSLVEVAMDPVQVQLDRDSDWIMLGLGPICAVSPVHGNIYEPEVALHKRGLFGQFTCDRNYFIKPNWTRDTVNTVPVGVRVRTDAVTYENVTIQGNSLLLRKLNDCSTVIPGTDQKYMDAILIYPNPADQWISVKAEKANLSALKIMDQHGRLLLHETGTGPVMTLDVTSIAAGYYSMEIIDSKGSSQFKKIMVVHE